MTFGLSFEEWQELVNMTGVLGRGRSVCNSTNNTMHDPLTTSSSWVQLEVMCKKINVCSGLPCGSVDKESTRSVGVIQVCCSQSPWPHGRPLLTQASAGDTQTLKGRSGSGSVGSLGPGAPKVLSEPSEHLWQVWNLILNVISPLLPSSWGLSFSLGCGVSFCGGFQHSPVDGCSAASCNFEVLVGENEHN